MIIKFWGVRGSIPSPGAEFVRYGGNTSCVSVQINSDDMYIFDAGTGLKKLGRELFGNDSNIYIIHTHNHWDHLQGFPFFAPLYEKDRKIHVFKITSEQRRMCALVEQMDGAHFPVHADDLISDYICPDESPVDFLRQNGLDIESIHTNHPGGGYGYRINHDHHSIVYLTDNELIPPGAITTQLENLLIFAKMQISSSTMHNILMRICLAKGVGGIVWSGRHVIWQRRPMLSSCYYSIMIRIVRMTKLMQ